MGHNASSLTGTRGWGKILADGVDQEEADCRECHNVRKHIVSQVGQEIVVVSALPVYIGKERECVSNASRR